MAEFGWAYVAGGAITGAEGPTGSIQVKKGPTQIGGYDEFVWNSTSNTLVVTGGITVVDTDADNDSSPTITLRSTDDGHINDGASLRFERAGPIATGENLGELWWYGSNTAGDTYYKGAAIIAEGEYPWDEGTDHPTRIKFATTSGNGSATDRMILDSSGNLGIGIARPTHKLEVDGVISASSNISASAFYGDGSNLENVGGGTITALNNQAANRLVTIGSTTTELDGEANLTFDGSILEITGGIVINDTSVDQNTTPTVILRSTDTGTNDGAVLRFDKIGPIGNGENLGEMWWYGSHSTTGSYHPGAVILAEADSAWIEEADHSTRIKFSTTSGTGDPTDHMVLDSSGNLGIGTLSPTHRLQVAGTINTTNLTASSEISASAIYGTTITASYISASSIQATHGTFAATSLTVGDISITNNTITGLTAVEIGAAEDGNYADGLFTDFVSSTPVGTAIDKFNEVLKILAPSPAPSLSRLNFDNSAGSAVKLSFGSSNTLSDYTSSNTAAGFSAVDVNGTYQSDTSGDNFRLGVYKDNTDVTGFLNFHVVESTQNGYLAYSNDAFANAETGSLKLELNGVIIHSVVLDTLDGSGNPNTGSANSVNGNGTGFTNVSITASSFDGNNAEWHIFKHRTAKIKVDTQDMVPGWNYARAIHTIGATDYVTNYLEWINDPSGSTNDLSVSNARIENISLVGSKYLSGVEYNTDATANYKVDINNLYRNVYVATGTPISFAVSNSTSASAQAVPSINTGAGEDHTKVLGVTASLNYNGSSLVSGSITANVTVTHPFKSTISSVGSVSTGNGFLIDDRSLASSNTSEKFHDETFRKTSGSYDAQSDVIADAGMWDSQNHMTGGGAAGHTDGLLLFNQRLYSPVDADIPAGGDFSNLINVEAGQPDYSGVTGMRTFYRVISNSSGADLFNFKIESTKNGTTYNNSSLGTSNVHFFAKIPGTTGWMDISQDFVYGSILDGNGAKVAAASDSDTHVITFGTASVANNNHIMLKILADESWQGYISQLDFTLPANQSQGTPLALNSIGVQDMGTAVKLSFGASNGIVGYANANGSSISLTTFDSNADYTTNQNRRGVFPSRVVLDGTLNDGASAGSGFPADALLNGYSGSITLEVNGADVHTVVLSGTLNSIIDDLNANSSGFSLSAVEFSTLSNIPNYTKPYRTGSYQIGTNDQRDGWNYARVKHGLNTTNYIEWINDPSGAVDNTAVSTPVLSNFGTSSVYYQSGIGYFASQPTASFTYTGSNFYSNVYSRAINAIDFGTTTNCTILNIRVSGSGINTTSSAGSNTSMPVLNNTAGCETTDIQVTGTVLFNDLTSISGGLGLFTDRGVSVASTMVHPLKSDRTTSTASKTSFMKYSGSIGSTTLTTNEYFGLETYRIVSGNYDDQASITSSVNTWNSSTAMNNGGGHDDGMVTVNGFLISPKQIGVAGDTGNAALQAPPGNPDYSTLSTSKRSYYRMFRYTGVSTVASFTLTLYGDAILASIGPGSDPYFAALGANKNVNVEFKVSTDPNFPGADDQSTGWADVAKIFDASNQPNNDGAGIRSGASSGEDVLIDSGGLALSLTLGTRRVKQNQYFVIKITTDEDFTGFISRIQVAL